MRHVNPPRAREILPLNQEGNNHPNSNWNNNVVFHSVVTVKPIHKGFWRVDGILDSAGHNSESTGHLLLSSPEDTRSAVISLATVSAAASRPQAIGPLSQDSQCLFGAI